MSTISIAPARSAVPAPRIGRPAGTPARRPLRLTARGRVVFGALATAPVVVGLVLASVLAPASAGPVSAGTEEGSASFETVTVGAGESLWAIAERIAPASDPREVIGEIERLNSLEDSAVMPGQTLAIPAQYAS
ncbi:LysM peptidoglycan-binding domain-containing protein [Naasia sp. SYSU D00057]|uniref:LysM peptidoglycan-binding domain-containing protein n=1 Tax=Naasia sp. SYSU D00057 TaxID=2817380 RepID=UPI0027DD3BCD|nr:LysM peptidoglycan-binding domain-containing protein [Naasia sp. SYSU D00057]